MSDRSPNYDDRLAQLEAELERLGELADRAAEREARVGLARQPRPAKTYRREGESYPSAPCTVYPIIFLDSTFTETEGNQTRTDTDRQANGEALAFYDGGYLQEETLVDVYRDNGRWWITRQDHQARWIKFTVNDGSGFATTDSSVTVDGVVYVDGYQPDTAVTTVYNELASSNYIYEGDDNDKGQAVYDPENDKYWIRMMECP